MSTREKVNILLVDDQPGKLLTYEAILGELGENLIKANSGREALEHLLKKDVPVVLMDVNMPEIDGFELAAMIRQHPRCQRTAIIFVSAVHLTDLDRLRGYESGAVDYVSVPVVPEILRAKVSVFAELYRKRQEAERLNLELEERVAQRTAELEASTERLRASEERFRFVAETLPSIVWTAAANGAITWANQRFLEYCGLAPEEGRTQWPDLTLHPADRERIASRMADHLQDGKAYEIEVRLCRHDGVYRWFMTRAVPRRDDEGDVLGWFGITTDIHDQVEMSEQLREADRRKDEFLALLSHELRNPLAPVRNAVQILRLKKLQDPELEWCRDVIERQVNQLTRLVDDLLDVSRVTRGKIRLQSDTVDLARVVAGAIETSRPLLDQHRHRLAVSLPAEALAIEGDFARLTQIVANLLNNAAKYQDEGGEVEIEVRRDGPSAVISIRDRGMGIAAERLSKVFDLFSQEETTLDRSRGGLGIGLWLVKHLVEMHGGSVAALSEGPGRGSEFLIRLPQRPDAAENLAAEGGAADAHAPGTLQVMVVDDNRDAADSLALLLRLLGHQVTLAHDGHSAVQNALHDRPSVLLLDIGLPGIDGYEVCRRLRRQGMTETLIVAMTGYGQEKDRQLALEAGFDEHTVKPIDSVDLARLLDRAREHARSSVN
jgi:two-component system CheB/CheR fusion protein